MSNGLNQAEGLPQIHRAAEKGDGAVSLVQHGVEARSRGIAVDHKRGVEVTQLQDRAVMSAHLRSSNALVAACDQWNASFFNNAVRAVMTP
jgi:hypothetical protein